MKLYITPGSPYARMARIVVLEKGLESRVETIIAKTRVANSSYYAVNPSGRVPYLAGDDDVGFEESALICAERLKLSQWFDRIAARPSFTATAPPRV
jgi:glutathione S-transferase